MERFEDTLGKGSKTTTIRIMKKRIPKEDDAIYFIRGSTFRKKGIRRKIVFKGQVTRVETYQMKLINNNMNLLSEDNLEVPHEKREGIALADGFNTFGEMTDFFFHMYRKLLIQRDTIHLWRIMFKRQEASS